MAEYRLAEIAQLSGVSARNIRAYRERGLLDPPRREGRSAYYDDHHLAQLETINQLLRKGFTSVHIAEFFASMRDGTDLAGILGLQRAVFGADGPEPKDQDGRGSKAVALSVDPGSDEARRLIELGLAALVDGAVVLAHPALADVVERAGNPLEYVRVILRVAEVIRPTNS